jgi:predicted dehydrogenase
MEKIYNWAILGCGKIARKFSSDLKLLPNANLYATASRDLNRAKEFAAEFGFEKAYGSYKELVTDPNLDVVYVATPHSFHKEHTTLCLNHKKAVLCEKAFAINSGEVKEMIACARKNKVFLMEAFWTRFQPSFQKALAIIQSGELGKLKIIRSDFAFNSPKDPDKRLYNVGLGGGSLLDIGIYPVFAALITLGKPAQIKTLADFSAVTGIEETILMNFKYPGGEMASLFSSFASYSSIQTEFCCEHGYLRLNKRWFTPTQIIKWKEGDQGEQILVSESVAGLGYNLEAAHVMECLDAGKTESDLVPLNFSLELMELLDQVRKDAGIVFSKHDESNLLVE